MAEPFVIFPGPAGNHISTDDVNLLDADTAHFEQSIGGWADLSGATGLTLSNDLVPVFGNTHFKFVGAAPGPATVVVGTPEGLDGAPVSGDTQYVFSCRASADYAADIELRFKWYDAAGVLITQPSSEYAGTVEPDVWLPISIVQTSPPGAAFARVQSYILSALQGQAGYLDAACLREDSDPTFVPSLRIVGTLGETIDPVDMPIGFAADGTPLTVGVVWAGDGYRYTRMDGAVGVGPVVADFNPADIVLP